METTRQSAAAQAATEAKTVFKAAAKSTKDAKAAFEAAKKATKAAKAAYEKAQAGGSSKETEAAAKEQARAAKAEAAAFEAYEAAKEQARAAKAEASSAEEAAQREAEAEAATNKTTSAQTGAPVIPPYSADKVMTIAAAWSKSYTSVRAIKSHGAELIGAHGKDNYKTIMTAYKTMIAAYIENVHTETVATLGYNAVLEREFLAVIKSAGWRKWSKLIADNWTSAAAFLAACYPHTLTDGTPARVEAYTDGKTIYKTYRPIKTDTGAAAVAVLTRALDNLKTRQTTDKTTDRKTATHYTQTHVDGVPVAAYIAEYTDKTDKTGRKYQQITRGKVADIQADTLARLSVLKMKKDGARLATLAEYNKDLRAE